MPQKHNGWIGGLPVIIVALAAEFGFAHAAAPLERAALMLSGEHCAAVRPAIHERLLAASGVVRVDWSILPDHVMIDRAPDGLTAVDLVELVNGLASAAGRCKAEIMTSCITAEVGPHRPGATQ